MMEVMEMMEPDGDDGAGWGWSPIERHLLWCDAACSLVGGMTWSCSGATWAGGNLIKLLDSPGVIS